MIEALIDGERRPAVLADLARGTMRSKIPDLAMALEGRFGDHHALMCRLHLDHIGHLDAMIAKLDAQIEAMMAPFRAQRDLLTTIPGIGPLAAAAVISEIGADVAEFFPDAAHLASWAGLCPGNHESAGKRHSGKPRHGNQHLQPVLVECAWAAVRHDGYLKSLYHRHVMKWGGYRSRTAKKKAIIVVAHAMLVIIWHVLATGQPYDELGEDYFTTRLDPERETRRLIAKLEALGHAVTLQPPPDHPAQEPGSADAPPGAAACPAEGHSRISLPVSAGVGSGQTQARGSAASVRTLSGRSPATMCPSVTSLRMARSLARSAIHTCCRGSAAPGYSMFSGRSPRTPSSGPSMARMMSASEISLASGQPEAAFRPALAADQPGAPQLGQDRLQELARNLLRACDSIRRHMAVFSRGQFDCRAQRVVRAG